jgi:hypothetical protein
MSDLKLRPECVSDLAFDQLLGESAERGQRARVQAHLASCVRCTLRYEELAGQRTGFLERVPSWQQLHARQDVRKLSRGRRGLLWSGGALVMAAGLVLALSLASPASTAPAAGLRSKGGPRIGAYVKHGERVTSADDGSTVVPGDHVRFTYSSDEPVHFALLDRDAVRATTYFPLGAETERVAAGHDVALDFSIKLDAQPGSEQIYGLFCEQPAQLEPLRAALQATGRLAAPPHCRVDVLTLEKKVE